MPDSAASVLVLMFAFQIGGTMVYLVKIQRLFGLLKQRHVETWRSLGEPSLFLNNSMRNNRLVLGFLWQKAYSTLGDADTVVLARRVRTLLMALFVNFALIIVILFLVQAVLPLFQKASGSG